MTQAAGTTRPGGRSARTREAVHAAVRSLLDASPDGTVTVAEVAERSGVHPATIYRRWRDPEGLVLDTLFEELSRRSPPPVTGDLRADMLAYTRRLMADLGEGVNLVFARALVGAARSHEGGLDGLRPYAEPRVRQIEAMLTAGGTPELDVQDVLEMILAPVYVHALLGRPLSSDADAERLVGNLLDALARRRARASASGD
ncbi:TetR/AcrR family transcriptional regulator [Streptomyces sp. PTM05]|uniref:TetR/AcrR family transcriptional regulator n=1 Tax=Streptantibioticus parmotrematis TaxID=2873249 RepID=A0ABS7QQA4_9ACTN|nr:TetR/AcrR family transcriptional regulator [Streptantibioticus parmotrematis]MBY8885357.1 TetR/AcrR family transcriptional regulator [Streptantibioticus parmotrematis]